ncbi:hypothetical protein FGG08_003582 [Glutinoglossum americanum]|uniref:Ribosome maturation protein SDO1 n=1 Tax=Glutinoglossum americanum TaxID=1670608 RepID=A0A9P8I265_9PEZI|nr:hypothetical protein FGG08_003582 [Glutinoglossum americanum]
MPINQPSNQIKLTNVSLVRMKKGKKRYEIACYKNKVLEWRSGVETDLDNVLQIPSVFLSVSKGQLAPSADLVKSFGAKTALNDIILEILNKGELQVGEKERTAQLERLHNEVVGIVAGKLVNPETKIVYTTGMIEKALAELSSKHEEKKEEKKAAAQGSPTSPTAEEDADPSSPPTSPKGKSKETPHSPATPTWTGVTTTRSAKSQALDAMRALIHHQTIPVARARMRLRISCPTPILKQPVKHSADHPEAKGTVKDRILGFVEEVVSQQVVGGEWEVVGFVEPGAFKGLGEFIGGETRGKGRVEVLETAVMGVGDE